MLALARVSPCVAVAVPVSMSMLMSTASAIAMAPPRAAPRTLRRLAFALALASTGLVQATVTVVANEPRAFGWRIGDVVQRHVTVHVSAGLVLDEASVPAVGRRGKALELRKLSHRVFTEAGGGQRHEFGFDYQVFLSPTVVRTLEMPPVLLRFHGRPRDEDARIDAWPLTVAPLVPAEVSPRRGLGDLRPDAPPPPVATAALQHRLEACAVAVALLLATLFAFDVALPWFGRKRRPFERAWRVLKRAPTPHGADQQRAALRELHVALNRAAGRVLFAGGVEGFVAARPQYAPLRDELLTFFERSRLTFFATGVSDAAVPESATATATVASPPSLSSPSSLPAAASPAAASPAATSSATTPPATIPLATTLLATAEPATTPPATTPPPTALATPARSESASLPTNATTPESRSAGAFAAWLIGFARRLRDAERGSV